MSMHCITIYIGNWSKRGLGYQRSLTHIWWHMRSGNLALWAERESERIRKRRCVHKPSCFFVYRHENGCVLASFQATHFHLHLKNHEINVEEALYFWGDCTLWRASSAEPILWSFYCNRQETVLMSFPNALLGQILCYCCPLEHPCERKSYAQKVAYLKAKLMRKNL